MIWLTLRQYRVHIVVMIVMALGLAATMILGSDYAARLRAELGVDTCQPLPNTNANCVDLSIAWSSRVAWLNYLFYSLYILPGLVASYIGGPMFAVEFERGTHRLGWTQSVSRTHWALLKLAIVLGATIVAAIVIAPFGERQRAFFQSNSTFATPFDTFEIVGPALVSYFVFGLAVGALVGAWSRRIITGMFVGLLAFGLVRVEIHQLRPTYLEPVTTPFPGTTPFNAAGRLPPYNAAIPTGAWIIGERDFDLQGRPVPRDTVLALTREYFSIPQRLPGIDDAEWFRDHGVVRYWAYQPAERFWTFQWIEAAIFSALAAICVLLMLWRIRTRDA